MGNPLAQLQDYILRKLWPPGPPALEVQPIPEDLKARVENEERELRSELVRAQTEAVRLRIIQEADSHEGGSE